MGYVSSSTALWLELALIAVNFIAIVGSVVAVTSIWRRVRLELLRDRLFDLRTNLTLKVNDPSLELSTETKAYRLLREQINGTLRFIHRVRFIDIVFESRSARRYPLSAEAAEEFSREWAECLDELSPEARSLLKRMRSEVLYESAMFVASTSIAFIFTFAVWVTAKATRRTISAVLSAWFEPVLKRRIARLFTSIAITENHFRRRSKRPRQAGRQGELNVSV